MNFYTFFLLSFGATSFLIGLLIWIKLESKVGFHYFLFSAFAGLWGIFEALQFSSNFDYETSLFFARCVHAASIFIGPTWYHFTLIFSKQETSSKRKAILFIFYGVAIVLLTVSFSNGFISQVREIVGIKYTAKCGPLYHFFTILFFISVPMGFMELFRHMNRLSGNEKKQCLGLIVATGAGFLGGSLTFFPVYSVPFPQHGLAIMPLYPFFMAISMMKYGLLTEENLILAAHKDKLAALGILTASINHEIRGPLFLMRGTVETENGPEAKIKLLNQIDRITGIVSRLTHFAKKGVDEAAKIETMDLKEVLSDLRPLLQYQLNYQNIQYEQQIPSDLPKLLADKRYLEEILFNLILNACQALKNTPNPRITLSADHRPPDMSFRPRLRGDKLRRESRYRSSGLGSAIVITIADNGPGIPKDQQKSIFKPFHTTKSEGTGLGLYITKQLVEKCGGKIKLISKLNQGSKFKVFFKWQLA